MDNTRREQNQCGESRENDLDISRLHSHRSYLLLCYFLVAIRAPPRSAVVRGIPKVPLVSVVKNAHGERSITPADQYCNA